MAITFRTFFEGLAESAPAIVQMMYQYKQDEIKNMYMERQLQLEEFKAGAYGEYMGAETEKTKEDTARIKELVKREKVIGDLDLKTKQLMFEDAEATKQAMIEGFGSVATAKAKRISLEYEKLQTDIDVALAQVKRENAVTAANITSKKMNDFALTTAEQENRLTLMERATTLRTTMSDLTDNPELQAELNQVFQDNITADSVTYKGLMAISGWSLQNANRFKNPKQAERAANMFNFVSQFALLHESQRMGGEQRVTNALFDPDKGVRNSAREALGIKDFKDMQVVDPADPLGRTMLRKSLDAYSSSLMPKDWLTQSVPFFQAEIVKNTGLMYGAQPDTTQTPPLKPAEGKKSFSILPKVKSGARKLYEFIPIFQSDWGPLKDKG